jgi:hypothetical protein
MFTDKIVHIKTSPTQPPLSPEQKKFNSLIKRIESQKKLLGDWQAALEYCQLEAMKKLDPLNKTLSEHQAAMIQLLDEHLMRHKFSKLQEDKLLFLITDLCSGLLEKHDNDDIKAIYNKYAEVDYDTAKEEERALATEAMKAVFDAEFDVRFEDEDIDLDNPHATAERLFEKLAAREAEEAAANASAHAQRRKTAKQAAKEAREAEEAANSSKSVQSVYRQLASALHPDREPDPVERERKTKLMQQVTVAYRNKDLLKLLELQLAAEQIDEHRLGSLGTERLKHYNKVLGDQLAELKEETQLKQEQIRLMLRLHPSERPTPKGLIKLLKQDIESTQLAIQNVRQDLRNFQDARHLKQWLKGFRMPKPDQGFDQLFDDFPPYR